MLSTVPVAGNQQWLGTNLPSEAPRLCCPPCPLWTCSGVSNIPLLTEREFTSKGNVHSQQPLPWSCSSHSNYSNSPHIIFPQASCVSPSVPWMGTQKCKAAPQSSLGSHDLKHQNMEQLKETGKSTAFHQETEDLSMGNTKGKAQLNTNTPLGERERR